MMNRAAAAQEEALQDQYTPMSQFSLSAYGVRLDILEM